MAGAATPAGRWLLVVSARSKPLFDYMTRSLAGTRDIDVIVERRRGERRTTTRTPADDRRRTDRRTRSRVQRFPLLGYELVRRDANKRDRPC